MNRNFFLPFFLIFCSSAMCQIDYDDILEKELKKYTDKDESFAIQPKLFKENMSTAFSNVIFSNSDLVSNASAFGYSQNEEKTNVSVNANLRLGKKLSTKYLRVGASATGTKNVFDFYSSDSWNNNVAINIGFIFKVFGSSTFFTSSEDSERLLNERRKINASIPFYEIGWYNQTILDAIIKLKKRILNRENDLLKKHKDIFQLKPNLNKLLVAKDFDALYSELEKERKKITKFLEISSYDKPEILEKYIKDTLLYKFDKENDITYGYSLKWVDVNLSLGNGTYKFTEDNIETEIVDDFENKFDLSEDLNQLKSTLSVSFNHTQNRKNIVWYYQFGTAFSSGSFLENSLINGTPKIVQNNLGEFILQDEDERGLGKFADIKKNLQTGSFNIYGAIFFTKNKNFGFNAALRHNYLIDKPDEVFYKNNFTALFGPIFRKVKDDKTSLTFGIDIGLDDAIYNTKVTGDFTGRIRLGIPFNIYEKKKVDKKVK